MSLKYFGKKNQQKTVLCEKYFNEGKLTVKEICERLEISRATYYKYLQYRRLDRRLRPHKS